MADHIQRVLKPNFGAAWDEVGDEFEKEETFTLSAIKTLEGKVVPEPPSRALNISLPPAGTDWRCSLVPVTSHTERQIGQNPSQVIPPQLLSVGLQLV